MGDLGFTAVSHSSMRRAMVINTLPKFDLVEGRAGQSEWVEKVEKINPYSLAGKIKKKNGIIRGPADHKGQRWGIDYNPLKRSAPDDKGYTWSMGYNQLSGRYTQGRLFPELSGSSLNRKKNKNERYSKILQASDRNIIRLAYAA